MNERQIETLLDANERQHVLLGEIRDLLAARLPVPVEESEVERLRQQERTLDRLFSKLSDTEKDNERLLAALAALKAAATDTPEVFKQPQDKPGRWVLFSPTAQHCQYRDRDGWFDTAGECKSPWRTKDGALSILVPVAPGYHDFRAINLDDHKETP